MHTPISKQSLASSVTLTGSAVASTNSALISDTDQHTLYMIYTPGESGSVLSVTIESTPDDTKTAEASANWFQDQQWSDSSGTKTRVLKTIQHTSTGTDPVYLRYDVELPGARLRIKYSEVPGTSVYGTISADLFSTKG